MKFHIIISKGGFKLNDKKPFIQKIQFLLTVMFLNMMVCLDFVTSGFQIRKLK